MMGFWTSGAFERLLGRMRVPLLAMGKKEPYKDNLSCQRVF
jgi:hypothetical protein